MKRILFPIVAAGASLLAISAHAADGQINFEGELTAQTCLIDVDGNAANPAIVTLAKVAAAGLQTAGTTAAQRNFNINLKNCVGVAGTARAFFEDDANFVDSADGTLKNLATGVDAATLVGLQLVDGISGAAIVVGSGLQIGATGTNTARDIVADMATLPYAVQYISRGAATAGKVNGSVTYSIVYE